MKSPSPFAPRNSIREAIRQLHASPYMALMHITGAGLELPYEIWRVPGASASIISASEDGDITYLRNTTKTVLGRRPRKFVSNETAIGLATRAHLRATDHLKAERSAMHPMGLGLTACVESAPQNPEIHEVYGAVRTDSGIWHAHLRFPHNTWNRVQEGRLCAMFGLNLMLQAAKLQTVPCYGEGTAEFMRTSLDTSENIFDCIHWPDGRRESLDMLDPRHFVLYPGSFDRLTWGHEGLAGACEEMLAKDRKRVIFLINVDHPDKGTIPLDQIARRAEQFLGEWPVILRTGGARYIDMAEQFPGFRFLLGVDTLERIVDPQYYDPDEREMLFRTFNARNSRFSVAGRTRPNGTFQTLADVKIPDSALHLFQEVPGRWDISSTAIRRAGHGA